jgi:hypothetical protein
MKKRNYIFAFLLMLLRQSSFSQVTTPSNAGGPSDYVGWNASQSFDLDIWHKGSNNINFKTGSTLRGTILSNGKFGIGNFTPNYLLDVNGDININDDTKGLRMGSSVSLYVLRVGLGANNCYVGTSAGGANPSNNNTSVGAYAGGSNLNDNNTFVGAFVGFNNEDGEENSFVGCESGNFNYDGSFNTFMGFEAGKLNISGDSNVFIGYRAEHETLDVNNSVTIGYETQANDNNMFILGNNNQNVGIRLSDDIYYNGPRSALEINADESSTDIPSNPSEGSGLRFRQLTSASPTGAPSKTWVAPYGHVLTVDESGIVKLTDGGGIPFGECNSSPIMEADMAVAMADKHIYYDDDNSTSGVSNDIPNSIGIGYECGNVLRAKLSVWQNAVTDIDEETTAGYFQNSDQSTSSIGTSTKRGIWAVCNGASTLPFNIAGEFFADSSETYNIGIKSFAGNIGQETFEGTNYGGFFNGSYGQNGNIGLVAQTFGGGGFNYGIYASAPIGSCPGGAVCPDAAGYFDGEVNTTASIYKMSDANLKDNIEPIQNPIAIIQALEPKLYTFRTNQFSFLNLPTTQQAGFLAQDVETILPNLVKEFRVPPRLLKNGGVDTTGIGQSFKAISYESLIPYLVAALKELKSDLDETKQQLNNCCRSGERRNEERGSTEGTQDNNDGSATIEVDLSDVKTIILDQNTPNPFSEETFISYVIPNTVSKAQIIIFDKVGNVLRTVEIPERGEGKLHVYSEKLSSGVYSYSLVADGKTIDTKKMVCQK